MIHRTFSFRKVTLLIPTITGMFLVALAGMPSTVCHADAPAAESVTVLGKGKIEVPAEFERVKPKSRIIAHEFKASAGDQSARVTMMAAGGDVKMNINRWKGQFSGGDADKIKAESMTKGEWTIHVVDVNGNYVETMGGGPFSGGKKVKRENYAMAGAILVDKQDRKFFAKLIGPASVVEANRERFVEMVQSIED